MPDVKETIEIAIKAEMDAAENYRRAARQTNLFLLRDKFQFLVKEEEGHRRVLERLFAKKFPHEDVVLPDTEDMPYREFREYEVQPTMQLHEIIEKAMEGEKRAIDFYQGLGDMMEEDDEKAIARYLASMEESHYYLLKSELEMVRNFELYDEVHNMMHVGP
ncbi:MAG: ferritin family protein [Candidatus Thermoplasmatota archaeon]|nr:ferritin family protein [Candidatus Thermoplasmatota archaeon]